MPNYNFRQDLPIAKQTESEVAKILERVYNAKILEMNNDNRFDIMAHVNNNDWTFEVKEDFTCEKTGNVGLEFECRGKPSGISVSQADFYVYKIHTKNGIIYQLYRTKTLKNMIVNQEYFRIVNGGDKGSNSMNYLFKLDVFLSHGKRIN